MKPIPTMFQCHGAFRSFDINNIVNRYETIPSSDYCLINNIDVVLKGRLSQSAPLKDILQYESDIDLNGIGSYRFKLKNKVCGQKFSMFIFNTGKWKLSGGVGSVSNSTKLEMKINNIMTFIEQWFDVSSEREYKLCCVNGLLKLGKANKTRDIMRNLRQYYFNIIEPQYDKKGRRNCWKLYAYENRKCQISVGREGNAQIFGCISIEELNKICKPLIDSWS